jgi:DnaJ-domain-containing protein 1
MKFRKTAAKLRPSLVSTDCTLLQQVRPMPREQYEVSWKDYYEILQVHPKAEPEVILAAYRKLAQVYHPDRNKSESATQRFQEINEAKEVLSDPERRARYD